MSKKQFEREKLLQSRQRVLGLLEASRAKADPHYAIDAAGFWLSQLHGSPRPRRNFRLRDPEPEYHGA